MGIHAAMDHVSPQHEGFALWDKNPNNPLDLLGPILDHYKGENLDMAKSGRYTAKVLGAMNAYINSEECSCEQ